LNESAVNDEWLSFFCPARLLLWRREFPAGNSISGMNLPEWIQNVDRCSGKSGWPTQPTMASDNEKSGRLCQIRKK
jgi:hypothetical protein